MKKKNIIVLVVVLIVLLLGIFGYFRYKDSFKFSNEYGVNKFNNFSLIYKDNTASPSKANTWIFIVLVFILYTSFFEKNIVFLHI